MSRLNQKKNPKQSKKKKSRVATDSLPDKHKLVNASTCNDIPHQQKALQLLTWHAPNSSPEHFTAPLTHLQP